MTWINFNKL